MPRWTNGRIPRWGLIFAAFGALAVLAIEGNANAQRAEQARIKVAPTIAAESASQTLLRIEVAPMQGLPANSFLRVRGLPPSVSLNEGYAIGPGAWAVPLFALPTLMANVPAGVSGRTEITISLIAMDGSLLAEAATALVVAPSAASEKTPAAPAQRFVGSVAPPLPVPAERPDRNTRLAPRPPELSAEERTRAERLLAQGEKYLASGKVEVAREFFERAAEMGLAVAALRLASTYDPADLQRLQVHGIVPDRTLARKWYERARELGAPEADERLAKLGSS